MFTHQRTGLDEYAHTKNYPAYIQSLNAIDRYLFLLWNQIHEDEYYENKTAIIICTDHGRGKKKSKWFKHNRFVSGSSETWMAMLGAGIPALGELKSRTQFTPGTNSRYYGSSPAKRLL